MSSPPDQQRPLDPAVIDAAIRALRGGGLVALPTETVYGLGADASRPEAVARIFAAKGRPKRHPVIVHLGDLDALTGWVAEISPHARALADAFWPGPMTLILPKGPLAHDGVTGGRPTVGVRVPGHPLTLAILKAFGGGVAAPSANRFGRLSPTTADHVRAELGERVDLVVDGGPCDVGVESTIIDLTGPKARVLRPGHISPEAIAAVLGEAPEAGPVVTSGHVGEAPGTLRSHYAPRAPVFVVDTLPLDALSAEPGPVAVYALKPQPEQLPSTAHWLQAPDTAEAYTRQLYADLRRLDDLQVNAIWVERPPAGPRWQAVHDRLYRASAPR